MHPALWFAVALLLGQAEPDAGASPAEGRPAEVPAAPAEAEPAQTAPPPAPRPRRPRAEAEATGAAPGATPATPAPPRPAEPERAQVARAALAFLDPLLAGDAAALAGASGERFSFDGELRTGREEIRRTFRELLDRREGAARPALLDLELLPAADALTRLGPPPTRLAALAGARGTWVAIANVSRRPVVLFLAREGARWVVVGMHG